MDPVVVYESAKASEAYAVSSLLEGNGLTPEVLNDHLARLNPLLSHAVGGTRVVVPASQAAAAREILEAHLGNARGEIHAGAWSGVDARENPESPSADFDADLERQAMESPDSVLKKRLPQAAPVDHQTLFLVLLTLLLLTAFIYGILR